MTATTAQTFQIAAPGARGWREAEANPMIVQGGRVTAELAANGHWTVFAGTMIIAEGDTEPGRNLSAWFFQQVAARWDAQIENEKAEIAAAQLAEQVPAEADAAAVVEALGGPFWVRSHVTGERFELANGEVLAALARVGTAGMTARIVDTEGGWCVALSVADGTEVVRYHYAG